MAEASRYIYEFMKILQLQANYIPRQLDKNHIALECFINSSKPIKSMLAFSHNGHGRKLPTTMEWLEVVSIVDEGIPKDKALSLELARVELQDKYIELHIIEQPNELQLISRFKGILISSGSDLFGEFEILDLYFKEIIKIQGRMSNGVLIG